jgi:SAM-dependent methyltransferase
MDINNLFITNLQVIKYLIERHPELKGYIKGFLEEDLEMPNIIKPLINKYCIGSGLEIGAGKSPYCNPATTKFLDKFTDNKDGTPNPDIVSDASVIPVESATFDYVFSSHVLEHMQNTIATLKEWLRVIKDGGILFLLLPHGDRTFDKFREKTTLEHHLNDYKNLTEEFDNSHNDEIKSGWSKNINFEQDVINYQNEWGADIWDFEFRHKNGVIHYHVWTQDEIIKLLQYLGLKILYVSEIAEERPDTFIVVAKK